MVKATVWRPPGQPKSVGKRAAIIDAAQQLFAANFYESVAMDQVAKAAGVAKMTIYGHFHDKDSLRLADPIRHGTIAGHVRRYTQWFLRAYACSRQTAFGRTP